MVWSRFNLNPTSKTSDLFFYMVHCTIQALSSRFNIYRSLMFPVSHVFTLTKDTWQATNPKVTHNFLSFNPFQFSIKFFWVWLNHLLLKMIIQNHLLMVSPITKWSANPDPYLGSSRTLSIASKFDGNNFWWRTEQWIGSLIWVLLIVIWMWRERPINWINE